MIDRNCRYYRHHVEENYHLAICKMHPEKLYGVQDEDCENCPFNTVKKPKEDETVWSSGASESFSSISWKVDHYEVRVFIDNIAVTEYDKDFGTKESVLTYSNMLIKVLRGKNYRFTIKKIEIGVLENRY